MDKTELSIKVEPESSGCSCCSGTSQADGDRTETAGVDPVCGMTVDPATAAGTSTYDGRTYYFCAPGCRRTFDKDPASFLSPAT
jgi:Cu+-exporting ATPase